MLYSRGYNWNKVRRAAVAGLKKIGFDGLLSGAWFHKKNIGDTEVIDETPDVDTSRTWHKARALQFTGAEHIDIPLQLHYAQSTWKVEFEFIFEEYTSRQYIFDARVSPNVGAAMSIRSAGNIPDLLVYNGSSYASVALSEGLVSGVRYKGYAEYDGTKNKLFIEGITDTPQEGSSFTQVNSNTTFRIGAYIGGGSNFIGSIGWMRITQDNIVTAEYAFEEGVGTYCFNRISNNYHGTINNATISTFRVEDVRITNGDQGTFLNTEGYSLGRLISNDLSEFNPTQSLLENNQTYKGYNDVSVLTNLAGTINRMFIRYSVPNYSSFLDIGGVLYDSTFDVYMPSDNEGVNAIRQLDSIGISYEYPTQDDWDTLSYSGWELSEGNDFRIFACVGNSINVDDVLHVGDKVGFRNFELRSTNVFYPRLAGADTNIYGNPLTYKGQVAQPLSLVNSNGSHWEDSNIDVSLTNTISNLSDFSIAMYLYLDTSIINIGTSRTIGKGGSSNALHFADDRGYLRADSGTSGYIYFEEGAFSSSVFNSWQKLFVVRSNNKVKFYLGNEERTITETSSTGLDFSFSKINDGFGLGASLNYFALYSRALTNAERNNWDHYNIPQQNLENHLVFSAGNGSTIYDVSGNNNHGTIRNATLSDFWIKQDQFHWNLKKGFNKLRRFNGTSNYIQGNGSQGFSNINTQFRFTASFYYDASSSGEHVLFQNVDNTSGDNGDIFYAAFEGHLFFLGFRDVSASVWTNEVFTDPLNAGLYYVNGLYDGNGSWTATINGVAFTNTGSWSMAGAGGGFAIGKRTLASDRYFTGGIKFIEIYDSSDILAHRWSNEGNFVDEVGGLSNQSASLGELYKAPYAPTGDTLSNPAGKWHNDAETEINFPHTAKLQVINEQFDYKPFFYKNAQLDDATAAYSMRKVIADYEGPLLNVIRSSDLQAQDFYPDSRGDLDTAAITSFVNDATPVLDDYTGAAAAYSLRKVRSAYTGSAIEVRRSSNGDTLDIGFDANGDLDTTALLAFVGNNLCSNPNEWANGATRNGWTEISGSVFTFVENVTDPDGGTNATRITRTATGSGSFRNNFDASIVAGEQYTFSVYLRSTNSAQVVLDIADQTSSAITLDSTWTLYTHTITADSTPLGFADFVIASPTDGVVEVYNPMVNHGATALPFEDNASAGAGFGYVTTWYDQTENDSLNQNNATQSDPDKMPLVVSGGTLVEENGKAAILGDDSFLTNDTLVASTSATVFSVGKMQGLENESFYSFPIGSGAYGAYYWGGVSAKYFGFNTWNGDSFGISNADSIVESQFLATMYYINGNPSVEAVTMHLNGASQSLSQVRGSSVSRTIEGGFSIGIGSRSSGTGSQAFDGTLQEIIIFDSDQSSNRTGIEANIGRYYTIDGFADGRVATWYDQANANHATQATPDEQPLIVNDGVLVTENSKPAIQFDGVDDVLMKSAFNGDAIVAGSSFIISVSSYRGDAVDYFNTICHVGGIEDSQTSLITIGYNQLGNAVVSGKYLGAYLHKLGETSQINTQYLNTLDFGYSFNLYQNGVLATYNMSPSADVSSNVLSIGGGGSGNNHFLAGNTQELIIYDFNQSINRHDIEKNVADYYDITISGNAGVESWVKNVSFADMYQSWYDYEYLHRLFANFEIPNKVFKVLAYTSELTADQRQQVYDYLQKNYHPIYTPYSTRVLADGGTLAAGQTNTLTIIDSI